MTSLAFVMGVIPTGCLDWTSLEVNMPSVLVWLEGSLLRYWQSFYILFYMLIAGFFSRRNKKSWIRLKLSNHKHE